MQPMPGKIIVRQDGHAGPKTITREDGTRVTLELSDRFKEKDRPMTGIVLAVGVGKLCEIDDEQEIADHAENVRRSFGLDEAVNHLKALLKLQRQSRPVSVKAGDRVVFKVFEGDGIEWTDGSMCRCVTEDDLLAVIVGE